MSSADATPSSSIRIASRPSAKPNRLEAKPGESLTTIGSFPSALANVTARSTDWEVVCGWVTTSTSFMACTGLKKCMPTTRPGFRAAPADALLATNTSSLSVAAIAAAARDPGRVVGMHFFNPVLAMKLVEVVTHTQTTSQSLERAVTYAKALGKEPIVVKDSPGFASSRLGVALGLEAMRMLEEGVASAEDIDKAMELGYNHPMGPLKLTD